MSAMISNANTSLTDRSKFGYREAGTRRWAAIVSAAANFDARKGV